MRITFNQAFMHAHIGLSGNSRQRRKQKRYLLRKGYVLKQVASSLVGQFYVKAYL